MNELVFDAANLHETDRLGEAIALALEPGTTIALRGTLGAGKTRLVQAIGAGCGIERSEVVSPTFVLCQQYRGRHTIYHLDAYRLHDEDEFRELGADELFASEGVTIIEWADKIPLALPNDRLEIDLEVTGSTSRRFHLRAFGQGPEAILERIQGGLRSA